MIRLISDGIDVEVWIECDQKRLQEYNVEWKGPNIDEPECWIPSAEDKVCSHMLMFL